MRRFAERWKGSTSPRLLARAFGGAAAAILAVPFVAAADADAGKAGPGIDWARERELWSVRLPATRPRPTVRDGAWPREPLDAFVLARLEEAGLAPSPPADERTLIRRVTFDLTGLPPAPEDVDAFLADAAPGRYERLVERLLGSPRFGERMASLWLPLARYAEDQAHQVGDDTKLFYPNAHLYRRWVIDAFNEDLPYDRFVRLQIAADKVEDARPRDLAALGFLGLGPKYYDRGQADVMADEWEDRVDTVTRTFLGLTVACARCHDHKLEAIPTSDYYALAGVFASTRMVNRTAEGKAEKKDAKADQMDPATLHIVEDGDAKDLPIFIRGNPNAKGSVVKRHFLRLLSEGEPEPFGEGSGRRELADAIASPRNPLVSRVIVNRVWGLLLGRPIVETPSNFGRSGATPTHPELLDDLAARFIERGWSIKALIREIVLSSTYRQDSRGSAEAIASDPGNLLLGRMARRRLGVEPYRDALLLVSGELDPGSGPSLELSDPKNLRRTVYARVSRLKLDPVLMAFDYPDANVHAEKRSETTTAIQKLFVLNGGFVVDRARALAARLASEDGSGEDGRVRRAYRLLFGRDPGQEEMEVAREYLNGPVSQSEDGKTAMSRWERYVHALLASNEMLYVD